MPKRITESKRFISAAYVFHVFVAIGIYGISKGADMAAIGAYMAATALPLLGYLFGETYRKSE